MHCCQCKGNMPINLSFWAAHRSASVHLQDSSGRSRKVERSRSLSENSCKSRTTTVMSTYRTGQPLQKPAMCGLSKDSSVSLLRLVALLYLADKRPCKKSAFCQPLMKCPQAKSPRPVELCGCTSEALAAIRMISGSDSACRKSNEVEAAAAS